MRKLNSIVLILLCALNVCASDLPRHYIDLQTGGGVGALGYELKAGKTLLAPSLTVGAGYTWFILPSIGLQTGVSVTQIATTALLTDPMEWTTFPDGTRLTDYMGEQYTHRVSFTNWQERQQIWWLQVPIGLRFRQYAAVSQQNAAFSRFGIQVAAGVLLSMPVRADYTHTSGEITHTGWYEQWHLLLHDVPGRFETEPYKHQSEPFVEQLKPFHLSLYAETGLLIRLNERTELAVCLYAQWMPQDILTLRSDLREPLGFASNSINYQLSTINYQLFMNPYHGLIGTSQTTALHPWSAGLRLTLSLFPGKTSAQKKRCLCERMS